MVADTNGNGVADEDDRKIGKIRMKGPRQSSGTLLANPALTTSGDGVNGPNGSVFNVPVQVGAEPGVYTVNASPGDDSEAVTALIVE